MEVLFPDGSALAIDQFSSVDLQSPTLLRMTEGRVLLTVAGAGNPSAAMRYQIDTPVASAVTDGPGEFRVSLLSTPAGVVETELAVLRGAASLATERGSVALRAGERTLARDNDAPIYPQIFNSARFDAFDRWAEARRFDRTRTTASTSYLPSDLYMYGSTFDRHGAWRYEQPYGHVWYPSVAFDWRPYYHGYWSSIRPYGWTWIGLDAWSWPTHHYGRWGHARNQWFWIPERRWASAWVSWAAAPGYVGWCPLGFDNRPLFSIYAHSVTIGSPWAGWVILPRTHFGGYRVSQWAVAPHRLHGSTPFVTQASVPVPPPQRYAVPRAITGDGASAGRFAVPRHPAQPSTVASQQSPVGSQQSDVTSQQSAVGRQRSPAGTAAAIGDAAQMTRGGQAVSRNPQAAPGDRQQPSAALPLPIDRSRPSAIRRQRSEERMDTPGASAQPVDRFRSPAERIQAPDRAQPVDRFRPPAERQLDGEARFRQPLPQSRPLPQSPPLPTSPAYHRNPGAPVPRGDVPDLTPPQPYRQVIPRWNMPGAARSPAAAPPQDSGAPPTAVAPSAPARSAVPRWEGYSRPAPSAPSGPPPEATSPSPSRAVPRGAPPSSAPSAPAASAPPSRSGDGGGGGGGGRQRHP